MVVKVILLDFVTHLRGLRTGTRSSLASRMPGDIVRMEAHGGSIPLPSWVKVCSSSDGVLGGLTIEGISKTQIDKT